MNANGSRIAISSQMYDPDVAGVAGIASAVANALPANASGSRDVSRAWRGLGIIASLRMATGAAPVVDGAYRSRPAPRDKRRAPMPADPAA